MAGKSNRFSREGILSPKWSLPLGSHSMLEVSMQAVAGFISLGYEVRIVLLEDNKKYFNEIVRKNKKFNDFSIYPIPRTPNGQALSVLEALDEESDEHLIIWNCDSWINPIESEKFGKSGNYLVCSELKGTHWSFAEVDRDGYVISTNEKKWPTRYASTGFYSFESCKVFKGALAKELLKENTQDQEIYVAPIYNILIKHDIPVRVCEISPVNFKSFGTPKEYDEAKKDSNFINQINKVKLQ